MVCPPFNRKLQGILKVKISSQKGARKYKTQTQIWQGFGNYYTRELKINIHSMIRTLMGKVTTGKKRVVT